jgi:hypothetical protein
MSIEVAPGTVEYVPARHWLQIAVPVLFEYVPGAQELQEPTDIAPAYHNKND